MLFALVIGHAAADYWAQSGDMARGKNRHNPPMNVPAGQVPKALWWHWLTAHALIHAGAVWLVTGSPLLALCEFVAHWLIDFAKCENWTGPTQDQALHIACKVLWVALAAGGAP
jgi:hypothetical protein